MNLKHLIASLHAAALVVGLGAAQAQDLTSHKPWTKEDSVAINALVMYPDTIRLQIFEACEYPAAIVNIASLQKNTSAAFNQLMLGFPKEKQEALWNMTRYPGLINQLTSGGRKSAAEVDGILEQYPAEIRETARTCDREDYRTLVKINEIQDQFASQFDQSINDLPTSAQYDFRDLVKMPEVLTLLNDHLELAVRVGDRFKRNPDRVIHRADSMNLAIARQNAENLADWKNDVSTNPDAQNDLKNAAMYYARENGYTQEEATTPVNPDALNNYTSYPYPYWFGYPTWYVSPYWYPHPCWFDWGFYYDGFGNIVYFATPSYYFTNWYFYYPQHCARYPHLGGCYVQHYYGHRHIVNENYLVVHNWVRDNRNYLPHDFVSNSKVREGAIRDVGQLNADYRREGRGNYSPEARDQYFKQNVNKYPTLKAVAQQPKMPEERSIPEVRQEPVAQPRTVAPHNVAEHSKPFVNPSSPGSPPPAPENGRPTAPAQQRVYNYNKVNNGQEYHRSTWQQSPPARSNQAPEPTYSAPRSAPAPAPRQSPAPAPRQSPTPAPRQSPSPQGGHR